MIRQVFANEITNDALPSLISAKSAGAGLAYYIAQLWKTIVIVGGLAFLIYLLWGGIEYLIAGGDKGHLDSAKNKIVHGAIGLGILVGSFAITKFIETVFQINLLNPTFPNALIQ
jgi:hypothetical protein